MSKYWQKIRKRFYTKPFILIVALLLLVPLVYSFTRFMMNRSSVNYLESKNFYFNSNRLKKDKPLYLVNNWSGVGDFPIEILVNSHKNNLLFSAFDVAYNVAYTCSADVTCALNKSSGVIYQSVHSDSFTLTVTPNRAFNDGESITINIVATSTSPYVESISADFKIVVGKRGITYFIDDEENRPYLLVSITNALTYYTVKEAFDVYSVGEQIDETVYRRLNDADKAKCLSAVVTLDFDPNELVLDITSSIFSKSTVSEQIVGGIPYVNQLTFPMDAMSSLEVRFYKLNHTQNYTYPFETAIPIVTLSAE